MLTTLGTGLAAGNPGGQIALDTLAAPDIIASNIMSNVIDPMFHPSEAYTSFPERVGETAGHEDQALRALAKGLSMVQSREELGALVNEYKKMVGQSVGGYGKDSGPYDIPMLPEIGARTHEQHTTPTDFASITRRWSGRSRRSCRACRTRASRQT
jgi:hypothetical protein